MDIYQQNGYSSRADYLRQVAEDYDISHENLLQLADLLGPEEDFDGLIATVEDFSL